MNQSEDYIDYESSVSSNLSFLDNEDQHVSKNQKSNKTKKSNNNTPQKHLPQSKQKDSKEKSSKLDAIDEEEPSEVKIQQQQTKPESIETEADKKKENTEMEEEDKQQGEDQEEEGIGEEETNNNNIPKDSDNEIDDEKDDEDEDDEDDGQDEANNQKDGTGATNQKKKSSQQANNINQKKTQQKQKESKSNSNTAIGNQASTKSNNNQTDKTGNKQNAQKSNTPISSTTNKQTVDSSSTQKLNQKRNIAQREKEVSSNTPTAANQVSNNTANSVSTAAPIQQSNTSSAAQPVKQTKKLGQKFYLYKEGVKLPDLSDQLNQQIEVRVSKEYIHRFNKQYLSRSIWGSESYTSDSDIVCILLHHGLVRFDSPEIQKDSPYAGVQVRNYMSQEKNGICSRQNKNYQGSTIKPETSNFITTLGPQEDLNKNAALMSIPFGRKKIKPNIVLQARNILAIPEVSIVFNLSNDPAYKYSIVNFSDKSEESKDWMSHKLQTHALYIETDKERYEISRIPEDQMNLVNEFDSYKFSRVKDPQSVDNEEMQKVAIPLSPLKAEQIYRDLDWTDFKWGSNTVLVKDLEITNLKCFKLYLKNQD